MEVKGFWLGLSIGIVRLLQLSNNSKNIHFKGSLIIIIIYIRISQRPQMKSGLHCNWQALPQGLYNLTRQRKHCYPRFVEKTKIERVKSCPFQSPVNSMVPEFKLEKISSFLQVLIQTQISWVLCYHQEARPSSLMTGKWTPGVLKSYCMGQAWYTWYTNSSRSTEHFECMMQKSSGQQFVAFS